LFSSGLVASAGLSNFSSLLTVPPSTMLP
jgi:hypothetical protein